MISNLRDAELQIEAIKRTQNDLIRELQNLKRKENSHGNGTQVHSEGEIDSVLNADKNTVVHKLYHIFDRIKTNILETLNLVLDTLTANTITVTNLNGTNLDMTNGEFDILRVNQRIKLFNVMESMIDIATDHLSYTKGTYLHPTLGWVATDSNPVILQFRSDGWRFYYNTGVTVGSSFGPNMKLWIGANDLTPNRPLLLDPNNALATPVTVFTGTIYVAASSGGPATTPKTFIQGICTS